MVMAHYAFLDHTNTVVEVITGRHETESVDGIDDWEGYYSAQRGLRCVRTSYNSNIRKQYASTGFTYDDDADVFVKPQPYLSWSLDNNHDWQPPTPMPDDGMMYSWNESDHEWVAVHAG